MGRTHTLKLSSANHKASEASCIICGTPATLTLLPLPAAKVADIATSLATYDLDRLQGAFAGQYIDHDAKVIVA